MKRKRKTKRIIERDDVTPERRQHGEIVSVGMARKVVPVIDTLLAKNIISEREHRALGYYRDQASLADRSPLRSCCDTSPRGTHGPGVAIVSALIETGRIERDLGALRDITRAVAVDDVSLAAWCIRKHGAIEVFEKDEAGSNTNRVIKLEPVDMKHNMEMARLELRMAARRISE